MDFVRSSNLTLARKSGAGVQPQDLAGKVVAVYFSAHWCPPCRSFTPVLKNFHEEVLKQGGPFEIIFVSGDKTEEDGKNYFADEHGDWLMVDFAQKAAASKPFDVKGIPTLVVIDAAGKVVVQDARSQVHEAVPKGPGGIMAVFSEWQKLCGDWRQTAGSTLGGSAAVMDKDAVRAARLARLAGGPPPPASTAVAPAALPPAAPTTPVPPVTSVPARETETASPTVDSASVEQLVAMGFDADRAREALIATKGDIGEAAGLLV
eukprot:TRINITY_DN63872_c0_g1_i1.p1 TRINITY_DN63872_c0_g1~~TRINITY_DN63872_c0_g1_i1.p1  ORF type:complete len:263 (-),score=54.23 TRINITY_DN63872_c0_g1_i1:147-935(-)